MYKVEAWTGDGYIYLEVNANGEVHGELCEPDTKYLCPCCGADVANSITII